MLQMSPHTQRFLPTCRISCTAGRQPPMTPGCVPPVACLRTWAHFQRVGFASHYTMDCDVMSVLMLLLVYTAVHCHSLHARGHVQYVLITPHCMPPNNYVTMHVYMSCTIMQWFNDSVMSPAEHSVDHARGGPGGSSGGRFGQCFGQDSGLVGCQGNLTQ